MVCERWFIAVSDGRIDGTKRLIKRGFKVNSMMNLGGTGFKGATALYLAASGGWNEIVKILLQSGADADKASSDGSTPLFVASQKGKLDVVVRLVEEGKADVDKADVNKADKHR